jgi:hypothetical protein
MCNLKNLRFIFKGVIFPFSIVLTCLITSSIYINKINNYNYGKITAYIDNNLYTDANPFADSLIIYINTAILFIYIIFNWLYYKSNSTKESFYLFSTFYSLIASVLNISIIFEDIDPVIPANIYLLKDSKYILMDNIKITYLRDETQAVRIIMADDKFSGYEQELPPGPWLQPYSLSWMSDCVDYFVNQKYIFKNIFIAIIIINALLVFIYTYIAYQKYNRSRRINVYNFEDKYPLNNISKPKDEITEVEEIKN